MLSTSPRRERFSVVLVNFSPLNLSFVLRELIEIRLTFAPFRQILPLPITQNLLEPLGVEAVLEGGVFERVREGSGIVELPR